MVVSVRLAGGEHRLAGDWAGLEVANGFLDHLRARAFSPTTVRAYAFDVANFARFLAEQHLDPDRGGTDGRVRVGGLAGRTDPGHRFKGGPPCPSRRGTCHRQPACGRSQGVLRVPHNERDRAGQPGPGAAARPGLAPDHARSGEGLQQLIDAVLPYDQAGPSVPEGLDPGGSTNVRWLMGQNSEGVDRRPHQPSTGSN